jgi:hypothetical protein
MCGIICDFKPLGMSCGLGKLGGFSTPGWSKQTLTDFRGQEDASYDYGIRSLERLYLLWVS